MATMNYRHRLDAAVVTAPADFEQGAPVRIGSLTGIAAHSASSGDELNLLLLGVVDLPQVSPSAAGVPLYLTTGHALTETATSNPLLGVSLGSPRAATVRVAVGKAI